MRKAIEHDQATLEISREIGDRRIEGNALGALGLAYTDLGLVDIPAPDILGRELYDLRTGLLADPYFKGVPSIQPEPVLRQALSLPPSD